MLSFYQFAQKHCAHYPIDRKVLQERFRKRLEGVRSGQKRDSRYAPASEYLAERINEALDSARERIHNR
jgi:hypothetical protein